MRSMRKMIDEDISSILEMILIKMVKNDEFLIIRHNQCHLRYMCIVISTGSNLRRRKTRDLTSNSFIIGHVLHIMPFYYV